MTKLDFPNNTLKQLVTQTGLSYGHLWRLAKKSGQKPIPGYPTQRTQRYEDVDWSRPLVEIAAELGVSRQAASVQRMKWRKENVH
jgi:hypothetical protein